MVAPKKQTLAWYRNPRIIAALGTLAIILIGVIVWVVQSNAEETDKLAKRQETLDEYTDEINTLLQQLRAPAGAMAQAPPALEDPEVAKQLEEDAKEWATQFEDALKSFGQIVPSQQRLLPNAHNLYNQSIQIYMTAAGTYQLAGESEGTAQQGALALATNQRTQAAAVWTEATALLDEERRGADLELSGLTAPDAPAAGAGGTSPTGLPPGELPPGELPPGLEPPTDGAGGDGGGGDNAGGGGNGGGSGGGNNNGGGGNGQ
ncbi:MAG TPA: hypothetical protein VEV82_00460 [Actinomycetota bacterium]|nr:hypothetical protein [Actinomycetota bacterium]